MPVRATVDLRALRRNFARAKAAAPKSGILSVLKADAYGHGLVRVARALEGSDGLCVARLDEALRLRQAGIATRIVVLSGVVGMSDFRDAAHAGLDVVVHHEAQLHALERLDADESVCVWLKVDSGMHRLGLAPARVGETWERLERSAAVRKPVRLMTHLSSADRRGEQSVDAQIDAFLDCTGAIGAERSIANSAGLLGWPRAQLEWVRPGIMLYGISPFAGESAADLGLAPVMTLSTVLIAVKKLEKGSPIGYGGTWICPESMPVGVAAIGYGDGYPRHAPSGTPVLVNGARVPLVGRVSMDMITVDLRRVPDAKPGDPVTLWGKGLSAEQVADAIGTIAYELVCRIGSRVEVVEQR